VYHIVKYLLLSSEPHNVMKNVLLSGTFGVLSSTSSATFRKTAQKLQDRILSRTNKHKHQTELYFFWFTLPPWRRRHHVPPKRLWTYMELHSVSVRSRRLFVLQLPADWHSLYSRGPVGRTFRLRFPQSLQENLEVMPWKRFRYLTSTFPPN
jgi:hypothetical protein